MKTKNVSAGLMTADGLKTVRNWGYLLQGRSHSGATGALKFSDLAKAPHDLIVMDYSKDGSAAKAFSSADIQKLKQRHGTNAVVVSYISIGEASDYRDHWQDGWTHYTDRDQRAAGEVTDVAPSWLGAWNEDWPNSRKVRYWEKGWQDIIFNAERTGWLDRIVEAGFDGAYLDIIDGYYHWGTAVPPEERRKGDPENEREAAARMIDFVAALAAHAREINPEFLIIPQNGAYIIDALEDEDHPRRDAYLETINAIACEDLFFRGDKPENNPFAPDEEAIDALVRDFLDSEVQVLCVDYLSDSGKISKLYEAAISHGFLPYAAPSRELDVLGPAFGDDDAAIA
ncbi:MAG: endo alpha-1,4 polygalactosaminidase [Hyphomicrobium sp.]